MSAVTQNEYTGNGSTTNYSFTFPYLKASDIKCSLDAVATTAFTLANATTIQFNTAPANGVKIKIFRETSIDNLTATFYAGSAIKSEDLNDNFTQNLYVTQEVNGRYISALGGTMTGNFNLGEDADITFEGATDDAHETTLTVADPTADRTITLPNVTGTVVTTGDTGTVATGMIAADAITMDKLNSGALPTDITVASANIVDGTIVNADVNAAAAIDGTKVNPAFGSQNITTTGTAATGAHTVTGNIVVSGTVDGRDVAADGTKLDGIETAATADQTAAEIRTLVESATDSNVFTDADHTKLNGVDTGATDDQTASEIKTLIASSPLDASHLAANSVTTSEIADAELTTLAGMQSATASKLADSTALTADIADLNQIDGLTKQTTISDSDASFPTSGAVVDYVAAQLAPLGGFEVIANEQSFPNTQPSSGVVISIADAGGLVVSNSGTASGQTVGGTTVNITGIASNFNSSTVAAGIRFLVASTGSGQNYTYHKATLKEDDLLSLSGDINDFAERYRVGSSNPTSSLDNGDLFFNTSTGKMLVYNGTNSAWEEVQSIGNFFISTLSPAFDGSTQNFTLSDAPTNVQQVLLIINGVVQKPNAGTSTPSEGFALDGSTVKLGAAPANGDTYHAVVMGSTVNIGTPSNNTVTSAILQNGSVITAKLADQAVDLSKLPHGTGSTDGKFLRANNGADPTFETVNTDLVADTSPQLGGDLASNSNDILMADSDKIVFGTGGDFVIQHTGNTSDFTNSTSNLNFINNADSAHVNFVHDNEYMLRAASDGAVEAYYDNSKKFETTSGGCTLTGTLTTTSGINAGNNISMADNVKLKAGTGDDLQIYHDGSHSYIHDNGTGNLKIKSSRVDILNSAGDEDMIVAVENGQVELHYDNSKKIETTATGVTVTGSVTDSKGDVRSVPSNTQSSAYTIVAADAGKTIVISSGGVTVPASGMSAGDVVTIINNSTSNQTITLAVGVTLFNTGDGTNANRTLAGRGMATIYFVSASTGYISGSGLS